MSPSNSRPLPSQSPPGQPSSAAAGPPPPNPGQEAEEPELAYESDLPEEDDGGAQDDADADEEPPAAARFDSGAEPSERRSTPDAASKASTVARAAPTLGLALLGAAAALAALTLARTSSRHADLGATPPAPAPSPSLCTALAPSPPRRAPRRWLPLLLQLAPVLIAWLPARWRQRAPALGALAKAAPPLAGALRNPP